MFAVEYKNKNIVIFYVNKEKFIKDIGILYFKIFEDFISSFIDEYLFLLRLSYGNFINLYINNYENSFNLKLENCDFFIILDIKIKEFINIINIFLNYQGIVTKKRLEKYILKLKLKNEYQTLINHLMNFSDKFSDCRKK